MATTVFPSSEFRTELKKRGGATSARCYQCATCSSVCELAQEDEPFPRRQMLLAQWGLVDQLATDPTVWLCHQCNDCTSRCPRDAKPGDVMQTLRAMMVEYLSTPKFMGKLVGKAKATWPLLIGIPFAFWILYVQITTGFSNIPSEGTIERWADYVSHVTIDVTFILIALWVVVAILSSATRYWKLLGQGATRKGTFLSNLIPVLIEILFHKRFGSCSTKNTRKTWHLLFVLGFVAAFITTLAAMGADYLGGAAAPLPLPGEASDKGNWVWIKWVGNIGAVLLVVGGVMLVLNRLTGGASVGATTAFDSFFLFMAVMVGVTGSVTELARYTLAPSVGIWIYIAHLSFIMCLFATFPYCKFAHIVYRTMSMVHQRMAAK
jgi:quinone-modifying oxidoreductase subunit QmoC